MKQLTQFITLFYMLGCHSQTLTKLPQPSGEFGKPHKVIMKGYDGNIMEVFLTRDGNILLFNNLNSKPENTNLHWATKLNDSTFQYNGEVLGGVNTVDLEGVPTIDNAGNLYFVSTRNYTNTLSTLYQSNFLMGNATNIKLIEGISRHQAGIVNFDVEVSADGQFLYFVDAQFNNSGTPQSADFVLAEKKENGFQRMTNSSEIFKYINTPDALEYAACISENQLEFYFTRVKQPITILSSPEIMVSTRKTIVENFGVPLKIENITGFVEAPSISPDNKILYYHKKDNAKFVVYMVKKE